MNPPFPEFLLFRGKAKPTPDAHYPWHPVAYHSIDVLSCMDAYLEARPHVLQRALGATGASAAGIMPLLRLLTALHDIGKFSYGFYGQARELWPECLGKYRACARRPHTTAARQLWEGRLRELIFAHHIDGDPFALESLFDAAFYHHGRPMPYGAPDLGSFFEARGQLAAEAFASDISRLVAPECIDLRSLGDRDAKRLSWWVAGLISISDWLGSNTRWFPYEAPQHSLEEYSSIARQRAQRAIREAGLEMPAFSHTKTFEELTCRTKPSPAQTWALDVPLSARGGLFILEDVTGTGKTEAAHILIHRLIAARAAEGAYWGMPTQATANAMFDRQRTMLHSLFESSGRKPSLVLSHAQSGLHDDFRATVFEYGAQDAASPHESYDETPSEVACSAFIADDRRASLLADIGAGTIDQVLIAALPSKFNAIRLFGLSQKVLVLDEVHAYDAYMSEEIEALLEFQAALGGSAILLSATLPQRMRNNLMLAWKRGLQDIGKRRMPETLAHTAEYPLATVMRSADDVTETPVLSMPASHRVVAVKLVHDVPIVIDRIVAAAARGEAVAWIRNTVDSCIEAARALEDRGLEPLVFHARFTQRDRQALETEIKRVFGPSSTRDERKRVLVATQVVEQSLDLDFDLLVSDLAPIDLLIQRAGRLWRHQRLWREDAPIPPMLVLTPPFTDTPEEKWLESVLPSTGAVYQNPGVMWRTLRELDRHALIRAPNGLRPLIEAVYASTDLPPGLEAKDIKVTGEEMAARNTARMYVLDCRSGYGGQDAISWPVDFRVPTRLIDPQTVIRLGWLKDGVILPLGDASASAWKGWALSEVRVRRAKIGNDPRNAAGNRDGIDRVRREWSEYDRDIPLILFGGQGDAAVRVMSERGEFRFAYGRYGLEIVSDDS